jgi:SAM-dependent methyltransferase
MAEYVLDHHLAGERARLALMSRLLDPMHRRHLEQLGVAPGARAVEVGCGNGSISAWLAQRVGPSGRVVAVDLDLSLIDVSAPNLEPRQGTSAPARSRSAASTSSPRAPSCTTSPTPTLRSATSPPVSPPAAESS